MDAERTRDRGSVGWPVGVSVVCLLLAHGLVAVKLMPGPHLTAHAAHVAELATYPMLVAGAALLYVHLRLTPGSRTGWLTAAAVFGSAQGVANAVLRAVGREPVQAAAEWLPLLEVLVAAVLVTMLAAGDRAEPPGSPLLTGCTLALLFTTVRVVLIGRFELPHPSDLMERGPELPGAVLPSILLVLYTASALLLLRRVGLPAWAGRRMAFSLVLLAVAHVLTFPLPPPDGRSLTAVVLDLVGAGFFVITALRLVRDALARVEDSDRLVTSLEALLRRDQETLHEVAGAVAGISAATHLLRTGQAALDDRDRRRLESLVADENARVERLLGHSAQQPITELSLDAVVDPVVLSHQARGRTVEWTSSGVHVRGRADALTEVVAILVDNAAVHSGSSRVELTATAIGELAVLKVTDEGRGIPREQLATVLDWGARGSTSSGRGIGLAVAAQLVADMGGRLEVRSDGHSGTTVRVVLPTAHLGSRPPTSTSGGSASAGSTSAGWLSGRTQ